MEFNVFEYLKGITAQLAAGSRPRIRGTSGSRPRPSTAPARSTRSYRAVLWGIRFFTWGPERSSPCARRAGPNSAQRRERIKMYINREWVRHTAIVWLLVFG